MGLFFYPDEISDPAIGQAFCHIYTLPAVDSYYLAQRWPPVSVLHVYFWSVPNEVSFNKIHFSPQGPWKASFAIDHPHTPSTEWAWRKSKIMSVLHPFSCLVSDWAVKADFNAQRSKIAFFPLNYISVPSSTSSMCFTAEVKKQFISTMITAALFLLQIQPWSFALSTNSTFSSLLTLRVSSCLQLVTASSCYIPPHQHAHGLFH